MKRNPRKRNRKTKKSQDIDQKKMTKTLGFTISILSVIFVVVALFYTLKNTSRYNNLIASFKQEVQNSIKSEEEKQAAENNKTEETDITFTMSAIGDIMCHNTQYFDAYNKENNTYDFSYVFEDISFYTKTADIAIGSLETTFAGEEQGYSSYPTFNTPDNLAYELKDIGLDVLSTAGNHALDKGFDGLARTIDVLNDADISHLGTYKTQEEQNQVLFKYVKGIKIAFINYTYGTNGIQIPKGKDFCVNLIDKDLIKKHIDLAKEGNADIIVACMHWGTEYQTTPNSTQTELTDFLFQNDVDIVLGTHPHVLQPMEKRTVTLEDGTTKDGFIIYSLGNFIADQNAKNTRSSVILNLTITKHTDDTLTIDKADYVPIYMYKNTELKSKKMKLLDINKTITNYESGIDTSIGEKLYSTLISEKNNIISILGDKIEN